MKELVVEGVLKMIHELVLVGSTLALTSLVDLEWKLKMNDTVSVACGV